MFKKLIPWVLVAFVSACANTQPSSGTDMNMPCCKNATCCCKGGACKKCMKGSMSSAKENEDCPLCAKAEREWEAQHGIRR